MHTDLDLHLHTGRGVGLGNAAGAHGRRLIANLVHEAPRSANGDSTISCWVPWPRPVQAGRYSDLHALDALHAWVAQLHHQGHLTPAVRFSLEEDDGTLVGVLFDPDETLGRWAVLRHGGYLVFAAGELAVLDEKTFHATYCDPAYSYSRAADGYAG